MTFSSSVGVPHHLDFGCIHCKNLSSLADKNFDDRFVTKVPVSYAYNMGDDSVIKWQ